MTDLARKEDLAQARAVASQIRQGIHNYLQTLTLIGRAFQERHWIVLGYDNWLEYVDAEFGEERLKLPAEHRRKAVEELRMLGMSQRAIAGTIGVDKNTVAKDVAQVTEIQSPEAVVGSDGKTYQTPARRDPEPASFPGPVVATPDEPDQPAEVAPPGEAVGATSAEPQRWDPAERAAHDASVRRTQEIEAGHRAVKSVLSDLRTHVITIVSASRLGEHGLVTKELVAGLRRSIDMLEEEIDQ